MDTLLSLPDALSQSVLVEFLVLKDVVALDLACTAKSEREQFLRIISTIYHFDHPPLKDLAVNLQYMTWLTGRSILVTNLTLLFETLTISLPTAIKSHLDACCPILETLEFKFARRPERQANQLALDMLAQCSNLLCLTLPNGLLRNHTLLRDISQWCTRLETLKFHSCDNFWDDLGPYSWSFPALTTVQVGSRHMSPALLFVLLATTPNLQTLEITEIAPVFYSDDLAANEMDHSGVVISLVRTSADDYELLMASAKLQHLTITGALRVAVTMSILTQSPALKSFHMHHLVPISNDVVLCIAQHCTQLEELELCCMNIHHVGLSELLQKCALKKLNLRLGEHISNAVLHVIAEHGGSLTHIDIKTPTLNPAGLLQIAESCNALKEIRVHAHVPKIHKAHVLNYKTAMMMFADKNVQVFMTNWDKKLYH